ncbi:MAG: hypothetical protein GF384_05555, partial [Elusimicrobia bacterium]|nr:hypothetical protein [Elusimicrobiota bacterium]MBD3412237.1 hypothetical protein [Elusimicrobiota bacterium]
MGQTTDELIRKGIMNDKRKHTRITHGDTIHFSAEGKIYSGKIIDISRTGMQIMVNVPESCTSVKSITFTLPRSPKPLQIPCRLVRIKKNPAHSDEHIVGVEFSYKAEAQLILIENFIREMKKNQLLEGSQSDELRQIPRAICLLNKVQVLNKKITVLSIDNISTEGFLMSFEGKLQAYDTLDLAFYLPGDPRKIIAQGKVMYIVDNYFHHIATAGIIFTQISEIDRVKIRNFIVESSSSSAMKNLQERFTTEGIDEEYQIIDHAKIGSIFTTLQQEQIFVNVLCEGSLKILELPVIEYQEGQDVFSVTMNNELQECTVKPSHRIYFSFSLRGGSYYFKTEITARDTGRITCRVPHVLYQSEKRSYQRKYLGEDIELVFEYDGKKTANLQGKLVDISRRGFLCEVPLEQYLNDFFKSGQPLQYYLNKNLGLDTHGEIRHFTRSISTDGSQVLRIGVEAGINRKPFALKQYQPSEWNRHKLYIKPLPKSAKEKINSTVIKYQNAKKQEIMALLNATRMHATAPVVILPPAFGKKKETLSPL